MGHPLVVVPKTNGKIKIRVCSDYKVTVNSCVETKFILCLIFRHIRKAAGVSYFTKFQLTQAYNRLSLDDENKQLLIVNTPNDYFSLLANLNMRYPWLQPFFSEL